MFLEIECQSFVVATATNISFRSNKNKYRTYISTLAAWTMTSLN
jgi:hypothetical protein